MQNSKKKKKHLENMSTLGCAVRSVGDWHMGQTTLKLILRKRIMSVSSKLNWWGEGGRSLSMLTYLGPFVSE